jgi:DNA replication initiation complex subunit (GINS family)
MGMVNVLDVEEVGPDPLVNELGMERELAQKIVVRCAEEARKVAQELAAKKDRSRSASAVAAEAAAHPAPAAEAVPAPAGQGEQGQEASSGVPEADKVVDASSAPEAGKAVDTIQEGLADKPQSEAADSEQ